MEDKELDVLDFNEGEELEEIEETEDEAIEEVEDTEEASLEEKREAIADGAERIRQDIAEREEKKYGIIAETLSWVLTVLVALLIAVVLKNFVIINATIPSGSMENTIMTDDDLFGFRLAYTFSEPKRGDIIIFEYPDDRNQKYIKRIIGLPGEKVTIKNGLIYINDSSTPLTEDYLKEEWTYMNDGYEFNVPADSYLVLGDNRHSSWDSRFWTNTYVTRDDIIGKAGFRYYPFNRIGKVK